MSIIVFPLLFILAQTTNLTEDSVFVAYTDAINGTIMYEPFFED